MQSANRVTAHPDAPSSVIGLIATPDPDGHKIVDVAFTTPATTIDGSSISEIARISISRDNQSIKELKNIPASKKILFVEDDVPDGWHTYVVTASNEYGHGSSASVRCYVGVECPGAPLILSVKETGKPGEAVITWKRPEVGINGNKLSGDLTYEIYSRTESGDYHLIDTGIRGTEYVYTHANGFVNYSVVAVNDAGRSDFSEVFYTYIGQGRELPFMRSGTHAYDIYVCGNDKGYSWHVNSKNSEINAADNDDGYFCFCHENGSVVGGARASMMFEKVDISVREAVLSFYTYKHEGSINELRVSFICEGIREEVLNFDISQLKMTDEWNKVDLPLDKYYGKSVVPVFEGLCHNNPTIDIDCIKISTLDDSAIEDVAISHQSIKLNGNVIDIQASGVIRVYSIDGNAMFTGQNSLRTVLPMGLYLVWTKAGIRKVMIK